MQTQVSIPNRENHSVTILRNTLYWNGTGFDSYKVGETPELFEYDAAILVRMGKARSNPAVGEFPENYSSLNWCIKCAILDQTKLIVWQSHNYPKIIPSEEEARSIGLARDWKIYMQTEAV